MKHFWYKNTKLDDIKAVDLDFNKTSTIDLLAGDQFSKTCSEDQSFVLTNIQIKDFRLFLKGGSINVSNLFSSLNKKISIESGESTLNSYDPSFINRLNISIESITSDEIIISLELIPYDGSGGGDIVDEEARLRITNLENNESIYEVFQSIGKNQTGQATVYAETSVAFDRYSEGLSALCVEKDSNGRPIDEIAKTSTGEDIYVDIFDSLGNYSLSGIPANDCLIVYSLIIDDKHQSNIPKDNIVTSFNLQSNPIGEQININEFGDDKGVEFKYQVNVLGELIAGKDSYPVPYAFHCDEVNTSGRTIIGAIDSSEILQSDSGSSTGLFGGNTAGKYILVGSDTIYEGAKIKYDTLGIIEPDRIISEFYQDNTSEWNPVAFMGTNSGFPYESHGWNISVDNHESEQIFFGFNPLTRSLPESWVKTTFNINGVDITKYWARFRIVSDITSDAIVQQVKLHTNRIEIENNGIFKFGQARNPIQLFSGADNTVPNANIDPANEDVLYTPSFTYKGTDNEFQTNRDDGFGIIVNRKWGLDSSVPLIVAISFYVKGTGTGNIVFNFNSSQVTDGYVYDGTNTPFVNSATVEINTPSNLVRRTVSTLVPINQLEENSGIVVECERPAATDPNDTLANSVVITNVVVTGFVWKI